jgi:GNAT superfamily N-acetyltransferase
MITIEFITAAEKEELYKLFCEWEQSYTFDYDFFSASFEQILNGAAQILVAKKDGRLVGYVQIFKGILLGFEPFYEVAQLLVAEQERSNGIGKMLLGRVEELAQENQIRIIKLSSQVQRSRAHFFYENNGYQCYKISKFYKKTL